MDEAAQKKLAVLIQLELDGLLSDDQFAEMSSILKSSMEARRYYARTISIISIFRIHPSYYSLPEMLQTGIEDSFDNAFWQALSQDEKQAETLRIVKGPKPLELVTDVRKRKSMLKEKGRKIPISLWITLSSLAAMLLMMAYVHLNPRVSYEVATITDSMDTKWSSPLLPQKGTRLAVSSEQIELHRGIVKIESDKGVQIILEAPAKFRFLSSEEVFLYQGRLLAYVSESGSGFSVQTNTSKIIDLGTKFGVYAEMNDVAELHLFKGNTLLIAGKQHGGKRTVEVSAGRAVRIDHTGQTITDIPLRNDVFVHEIDSHSGLVWRGQRVINLADVVGGGSGLGTGRRDIGINPVNGVIRKAEVKRRKHGNVYTRVDSNSFVDGVFIPNGTDEQVVTTAGHLFAECPPTSGYFYTDISNTSMGRFVDDEKPYPLYLNQTNYSLAENPSIFMHSNVGITFDLNQFRTRLPGTRILRFQSEIGISDSAPNKLYVADFWVLIDGQVRYANIEPMRRGNAVDIQIEINEQDRFLTLMVTDGSVREGPQDENAIRSDWGLFGRPFLVVE